MRAHVDPARLVSCPACRSLHHPRSPSINVSRAPHPELGGRAAPPPRGRMLFVTRSCAVGRAQAWRIPTILVGDLPVSPSFHDLRGGSLSWWVISPYLPHSMTFTDPLSRPPRIQMTPHIPTPRQDSSRLSAARRRPPPPLQTTMMTTVVSPAAVGMAAAAVGMAVVGSILARQTAISPRSTSRRHLRRPSSTMYTKLPVRHSSASSLL